MSTQTASKRSDRVELVEVIALLIWGFFSWVIGTWIRLLAPRKWAKYIPLSWHTKKWIILWATLGLAALVGLYASVFAGAGVVVGIASAVLYIVATAGRALLHVNGEESNDDPKD